MRGLQIQAGPSCAAPSAARCAQASCGIARRGSNRWRALPASAAPATLWRLPSRAAAAAPSADPPALHHGRLASSSSEPSSPETSGFEPSGVLEEQRRVQGDDASTSAGGAAALGSRGNCQQGRPPPPPKSRTAMADTLQQLKSELNSLASEAVANDPGGSATPEELLLLGEQPPEAGLPPGADLASLLPHGESNRYGLGDVAPIARSGLPDRLYFCQRWIWRLNRF